MTAHVKKNMVVAGEYRARPAVKQATLPSGTVLRYGSEVDQEQLLARLQEKTVDANRRLGARPETFGRFVRTKKFPAARFGDVFQLGRKHMVRSHCVWLRLLWEVPPCVCVPFPVHEPYISVACLASTPHLRDRLHILSWS